MYQRSERYGWALSSNQVTKNLSTTSLISDGTAVSIGECKATATISDEQLRDLLEFTASHDARPVLGALMGKFPDDQRKAIENQKGRVFERPQLLAS